VYAQFLERNIEPLIDEGQQLTAILTSSLQTARRNRDSRSR
jgi:hypothetical protein